MERTNKGLVVTIVILTILVLGLGGYIVYDKFMNNEKDASSEKENKKENAEVKELSVDDEKVKQLMENISIMDIEISLTGWYYQKDKMTVEDMDNQIKLMIGLQDNYDVDDDDKEIISAKDIRNSIKKILGNDVEYQDESIKSSCKGTAANYNEKTEQYELTGGCGGVLIPLYRGKISKAYQTDKTIEIYQKAIYSEFDAKETKDDLIVKENIYKTDKKTLIEKGILHEENMDYSKYFDLSDEFKFIFTKEDNRYVFTSVEKVK